MSLVTFVVPVYCEEENIEPLIARLREVMQDQPESWEVLFVDDGSTDATWAAIEKARGECRGVLGLGFSRHFGKEAAIAAGLEHARGDAVIVLDADLQHPPALIPSMLRYWREEKYDVVEAVKVGRGIEGRVHGFFSMLFYAVASRASGLDLRGASDFKLLDARVVEQWVRLQERATFFRGLSSWLGYRRCQVPFEVAPRKYGRSRWSWAALCRLAIRGLTSFSAFPLQLVTAFGLVVMLGALVLGGRAIVAGLLGKGPDNLTILLAVNLFIGSMIMIALGILGGYVARIYEEVKARPRYVVAERLGVPHDIHARKRSLATEVTDQDSNIES